jgi:hypothetical protein
MRVTYDPAKSLRNKERRYQALGYIDEHLHMLVFTPRDGAVHVISLRRANQRERTRYAAQTQP